MIVATGVAGVGFVAVYPHEIMQLLLCNVTLRETRQTKRNNGRAAAASAATARTRLWRVRATAATVGQRHLKKAEESRPVNCGPRDRGVIEVRRRWNNAIGALRGGMPARRAHLFTICLVRSRGLAEPRHRRRQTSDDNRDDRLGRGGHVVSNRSRESPRCFTVS